MKKWIIIKLTSLFLALFILVGVMFVLLIQGGYFNDYNHIYSLVQIPSDNNYSNISTDSNLLMGNYVNIFYDYRNDSYYNANINEPYSIGNAAFDNKDIDDIFIDWAKGDIDIVETDDTAISISEEYKFKSDDFKLRYRVLENTLEIRYMRSGISFSDSGNGKKLTINLPKTQKNKFNIKVNATQSNIMVRDVTLDELTATVEIGDLTVNDGKIYNTYYYASTGNIYTNCAVTNLAAILNKGNIDCKLDKNTENVDFRITHGDITVRLPEDISGYLVRKEAIEIDGNRALGYNSDFEDLNKFEFDRDDIHRYGDESIYINAALGDGTMKILKE